VNRSCNKTKCYFY